MRLPTVNNMNDNFCKQAWMVAVKFGDFNHLNVHRNSNNLAKWKVFE